MPEIDPATGERIQSSSMGGIDPETGDRLTGSKGPAPRPKSKIEAMPPITSWRGIKSRANELANKASNVIVENLPAIGGTVGGLLGAEGGPPGAIGGAALGGAAGRAVQQMEQFSRGVGPKTSGAAAKDIAIAGAEQGGAEAVGLGVAKMAKLLAPVSRGEFLAYGAKAGDLPAIHGEDIWDRLIPDFDQTLKAAGSRAPKTISEFEKLSTSTMEGLQKEYDVALKPIENVQVSTQSVADSIRARITPNMANTAEGKMQARALLKRAEEFYNPWTVGDLDLERSKLAKTFKNAAPSSRAAAQKLDAGAMADRAANEAINDILYPLADASGGKPTGYFRGLKQKESALITLKDRISKAKASLTKQSTERAGEPLSERFHLRSYMHPGGRIGGVAGGTPEISGSALKKSGEAIGKGFPGPKRQAFNAARKAVSTALTKPEVDALPLRVLMDYLNPGPPAPRRNPTDEYADPANFR